MAFAAVIGRDTSLQAANTTSHPITIGTHASGDRILVVMVNDAQETVTGWTDTGWTELDSTAGSGGPTFSFGYIDADSSSETLTLITGTSEESVARAWVIDAGTFDTGEAPEFSTVAQAVDANPNPGSLTPTGGAKDYLWFAVFGCDDDENVSGFPTNYSQTGFAVSSTGSGTCTLGWAERELNAASEDPGTFTLDVSDEQWRASTIVIHPGAAAAAGPNLLTLLGIG